MRPFLLISIFLVICFSVNGQTDQERYQAWLDSMKSNTYIAMELTLDELEVYDTQEKDALLKKKRRFNLSNTDQFLHSLRGMAMIRRGNFANEPMLRGLTSERYAISIDGMRIFGACTDKMDPVSSYIEPINLRSLDVTFGTNPNGIGTSTGGGIKFSLKKPVFNVDDPFSANVGLLYGSNSGTFDQSADINYSTSRFALRLSGVHRKAQNYQDGNDREVRYSQYEKYNHAASLSYKLGKAGMIMLDYVGDNAYDVGYPALPMDVSSARAKMIGVTYMAPNWKWFKSPEFKVYHNFIKHMMDDTQRDSVAMHMDMPGETQTSGGYFKAKLLGSTRQSLSFHADYFRTHAYAEMTMYPNDSNQANMFMLTWPDVYRSVLGVELNHSLQMGKKVSLLSGARLEYGNSFIESEFGERQLGVFGKSGKANHLELIKSFSYGIAYSAKEGVTSKFNISYGERLPSISEQFGFYLFNRQDGFDYLGDPDLKKESNLHVEFNQAYKAKRFRLSGSVFTYFFQNYIMGIYDASLSAMTIGANGVKWYKNVGRALMVGGEASVVYEINPILSINSDLKYVYGEDFEGDPLPQMPSFKSKPICRPIHQGILSTPGNRVERGPKPYKRKIFGTTYVWLLVVKHKSIQGNTLERQAHPARSRR